MGVSNFPSLRVPKECVGVDALVCDENVRNEELEYDNISNVRRIIPINYQHLCISNPATNRKICKGVLTSLLKIRATVHSYLKI